MIQINEEDLLYLLETGWDGLLDMRNAFSEAYGKDYDDAEKAYKKSAQEFHDFALRIKPEWAKSKPWWWHDVPGHSQPPNPPRKG